jgi:hypothetical protein
MRCRLIMQANWFGRDYRRHNPLIQYTGASDGKVYNIL